MPHNTEIERKFLLKSNAFLAQATRRQEITQGYLCKDKERTIRVRICNECAFLTIKSDVSSEGIARFEWEKEIDLADAREMMAFCLPEVIRKTRYIIPAQSFHGEERKWEVDVFHGPLEGRILAELELGSEDEPFIRPEWLGEEVTGQPQYYNVNM